MRRAICALLLVLALSVAFGTKTDPAVAPVASDSDRSRPLTPSESGTARVERIERINRYFEQRRMPLAGYGRQFIQSAEECGMDWRLLPAIAVRESSGGKHMTKNNPFGWGSARIGFVGVAEAIAIVGKNLCGLNPATASYYKNKTAREKLWFYNGTVNPEYPDEVLAIMENF